MKFEDVEKILKGANTLHKMKLYLKHTSGGKAKIWVYCNYERKSLGLPSMQLTDKNARSEEIAFLRKAIEYRNRLEAEASDGSMSNADRKSKVSQLSKEWVSSYLIDKTQISSQAAIDKFIVVCGDISSGSMSRRHLIKMLDVLKQKNYKINYIRATMSRLRAFCNWAEQRGYMDRIDTRKLLPQEEFGEVKALSEEELRLLAATPCEKCPEVKDLFMLGVYTAQRIGEIKNYTFSMLYDREIKTRQGKTGKFIKIPLSDPALKIMENLRQRRESEGLGTGAKDKMFRLPSDNFIYGTFKGWLEAAGIDRNRITLHNSRSTAISLLINKGVSESITQELANHSDPRITARYYRQVDDSRKKEALNLIPEF